MLIGRAARPVGNGRFAMDRRHHQGDFSVTEITEPTVTGGWWSRTIAATIARLQEARVAGEQLRAHRIARESARMDWAARARDERIARAYGPHGVIQGRYSSWDGRVLRAARGRNQYAIPAANIAMAASSGSRRVVVTAKDGRAYALDAPAVMAEAITAVISSQ
jgi:hypothetical protein